MAGDIAALAFMQARLPLIDYHGNNANDQKHSQDRTVALVKRWQASNETLRAAHRETLTCCEVKAGKGDAGNLMIIDRPGFDRLQEAIAAHLEQISVMEEAIRKLDAIIRDNGLEPGYFADFQHRQSSAQSSIYQQKSNITKYLTFHTQKTRGCHRRTF